MSEFGENYYKKYKNMFDLYGISEVMYYFDMIEMTLKRLELLDD